MLKVRFDGKVLESFLVRNNSKRNTVKSRCVKAIVAQLYEYVENSAH